MTPRASVTTSADHQTPGPRWRILSKSHAVISRARAFKYHEHADRDLIGIGHDWPSDRSD